MLNRYSPVIAVVALATMLTAACGNKTNLNFCQGKNPDNNCSEPEMCENDSTCSAPTAVCDTQTSMCVQCTPANASACIATVTSPICGSDGSCRACSSHAECITSHVCLPDGSCADPGKVAYASATATSDNATCSLASPCQHVMAAVSAKQPYVKLQGAFNEAVVVNNGRVVTVLGESASLTNNTNGNAIVTVQGDGTSLSAYDLTITNAPNNANGFGVVVPAASGSPTVTLTRATITNNPASGVSVAGGTLAISQSTISTNPGGGISVSGGAFIVVGNAFFNNGSNTSLYGGLSINTGMSPMNRLEFNSFSHNTSQDGTGSGILCFAGSFTARNNIISNNNTASTTLQLSGSCAHEYSVAFHSPPLVGSTPLTGTGDSGSDPKFVNEPQGNLHLQLGSPAIHAADPVSDLSGIASHDIDGTPRVAPADIGAYEFKGP